MKKTPFSHQTEIFEKSKDMLGFGFLWEMRVGKTLPTVYTAGYLFDKKEIEAVIVLAPNGVHIQWAQSVLPEERPDDLIFVWNSGKAST
jgi:hypothetical protein